MYQKREVALCSLVVSLATIGSCAALASSTKVEVDSYQAFCACIILTSLNDTTNAFPAQQLLRNLSDTIDTSDQDKCNDWTEYPDYNITIFADEYGKPTNNISKSVGAFSPDINAFCGPHKLGEAFSFPDFSATTAGLLLPWLAIFAQLPRQTGSRYEDILSIFTSIGSPAWILSSIALSILFRLNVRQRFAVLRFKISPRSSGMILLYFAKICEAAETVVQAFDQAPVRLNPRPGFLSSLIIFPENHWWWTDSAAEFKALRRRVDAMFIIAIIVAVLGWMLAIIADFWSFPGLASSSNSSEWQICMGSLWLWVFPATYGPVANNSLQKPRAIRKILSCPGEKQNNLYFAIEDEDFSEHRSQTAITQRSGLTPRLTTTHLRNRRRSEPVIKFEEEEARDNVRIPMMWGFSIEGDGESEGISTFTCRFLATWHSSNQIMGGFESFYDRLKRSQVPDDHQGESEVLESQSLTHTWRASDEPLDKENQAELMTMVTRRPMAIWDWAKSPRENLRGTSRTLDQYLEIDVTRLTAYPDWREIKWEQWKRFIIANCFGLIVQWGTSGPAIFVMYFSPPVGLGCDSGGLLIYAVLATSSWLLLNLGNLSSHTALLHYQRWHHEHPEQSILHHYKRTPLHSFYCGAAVTTRILGKFIAVINACWILVWSFLTYTNVMETPYCTTAYWSLRNHGWMRLWDPDPSQFAPIKIQELQCLVFGSFIAYFASILIFSLTSTRPFRWRVTTLLSVGFSIIVLFLYFYGVYQIRRVT